MENLKYGEKIIAEFDLDKDFEIWPNSANKDHAIHITLPEFACFFPRSGYPDFATIYVTYVPDKFVVELKALKLYINSFLNRHISHESSVNEIYDTLDSRLKPKYLRVVGDFNPRGNVHTVVEVDSNISREEKYDTSSITTQSSRKFN